MSLLQTIRGEAVVALCLFNGWVFALSWGGAFDVPLPTQLASFAGNGLWLLSLIVCTLVLGIFYVSRPLYARMLLGVPWLACGCMVASATFLAVAAYVGDLWSALLLFAGGVVSGVGTGLFSCCLGALATRFNPAVLLQMLAVSLLFSAVLVYAVSLLPTMVVWAVLCTVAVGCTLAYAHASGPGTSRLDRGEGAGRFAGAPFFALVLLLGLSGGLLRGLMGSDVQGESGIGAFALATFIAACALLLSRIPDHGEPFSLFYRVVAAIAAGFMVLGVFADRAPLALAIHSAGFTYFYGLLWALCCLYAVNDRFPARVFVGGLLFCQIGQVIGALGGTVVVRSAGALSFAAVSNVVVYVLLFASVALLARLSRPSGIDDLVPAEKAAPQKASLAQACVQASERFSLTEREAEVLAYLVKGYDRGYVAQAMGLSPETVKTHTRHIYEKTGAHSRTELLGLILGL